MSKGEFMTPDQVKAIAPVKSERAYSPILDENGCYLWANRAKRDYAVGFKPLFERDLAGRISCLMSADYFTVAHIQEFGQEYIAGWNEIAGNLQWIWGRGVRIGGQK